MEGQGKLWDVAVKLSCYDYRLEDIPSVSRQSKYYYVGLIRRRFDALHLRFMRPLGTRILVSVKRSRELARRLLEAKELDSLCSILPYCNLINSVNVLAGGTVVLTWHMVPDVDYGPVKEFVGEDYYVADQVPVVTCSTPAGLSTESIELLGSYLRWHLGLPRLDVRMPALAYAIVAVLDVDPLMTLREMRNVVKVAEARDVAANGGYELRAKYVYRYYRLLSRHRVVGRAFVYRHEPLGTSHLLIAPKECGDTFYGVLAASRLSAWVYYGEQVMAGVKIATEEQKEAVNRLLTLCPEAEIHYRMRGAIVPFPYECFDPIEERWTPRRNENFLRLINKLRLLVEKEKRARLQGKRAAAAAAAEEEEEAAEEAGAVEEPAP